ncbi:MAG: hypothetical protein V2I33_24820 [Kangiellaceae bacterium]|nr:hypothetical protein [Kangiellaceae bacterium]
MDGEATLQLNVVELLEPAFISNFTIISVDLYRIKPGEPRTLLEVKNLATPIDIKFSE